MKKSIKILTGAVVLAGMLIAPLSQQAYADRGEWMPIEINLEGKILPLTVDPVIQGGTTLVPMRAIFESLGASVKWDSKTKTITGTKSTTVVKLTIGKKQVSTNGKATQLEVAPKIINGSTMIPLRYVSESLGMYVGWVPLERQVYIAKDREIEGTTMASVTALYNKYAPTYKGDRFAEKPSYTAPYKAGKLADGFLQDGLKAANFVREMAKLPTLVLDSGLNESAQYGAVLLESSSQYTHTPIKPTGMEESFYQKALSSTSRSNIDSMSKLHTPTELAETVKDYMLDYSNEALGHRRSILDPKLLNTGFGYASFDRPLASSDGNISTGVGLMDISDKSQGAVADYNYITWPSKGYFPTSWFTNTTSFSVTLNPAKYMSPDASQVHGTVINTVSGTTVDLVPGQTDGFYVNTENFGDGSPIISFLPSGDIFNLDPTNPGDEFVIELSGIYKTDGTPTTIKYTVKLFAM